MEYFVDLCESRQTADEMIYRRVKLENMILVHDSKEKAALITLNEGVVDGDKIVLVFRKD